MAVIGSMIENFGNVSSPVQELSAVAGKRIMATITGIDMTQLKDVLDSVSTQPSLCYIPIQAESFNKRRQIDVSNTMLISQTTQAKTYITDNSAPHPRTWNIRGYIKALAPILENWMLIKPTLVLQEEILDAASESRQTVKFKTDMGEIVDVLITNLNIGSTPKGQNVRTIDVSVQEVTVLANSTADSLGLDSVGAASIPVKAIKNFGSNYAVATGVANTASLLMSVNIPIITEEEKTVSKPVEETNSVKKPSFNISGGEVELNTRVTIDCATPGATIIYTTDGSEPAVGGTKYTEPLIIKENVIVKAVAFKSGMNKSSTGYARYSIKESTIQDLPVVTSNIPSGSQVTAGTAITLSTTDGNATIVYTLDGSTPDFNSNVYRESIMLVKSATIKAMAVKNGANNSDVSTFKYIVEV